MSRIGLVIYCGGVRYSGRASAQTSSDQISQNSTALAPLPRFGRVSSCSASMSEGKNGTRTRSSVVFAGSGRKRVSSGSASSSAAQGQAKSMWASHSDMWKLL